ncbi:MAG: twin-arginine translocase subunit TatB, partial [Bradyrhizobiaceae bacterium]|nr:twin-arginine translocase subunit TatB [Bradyrhizobiaceae bacterium]
MFDFSWGHLLAVAVVALIVIGPKELPGVLRTVGQWTARIRRMAAEFQGQFQEALREAEMADLRTEIDNISDTARSFTSQLNDPMNFHDATKWEPNQDKTPATTAPEMTAPEMTAQETTAPETTAQPPAGEPAPDTGPSPEP